MDRLLYSEKLKLALNQQRLNGLFCDVVILLMDCQCFVHRCILATCSSQMEQELLYMQSEGRNQFDLRMITFTVFQVFADYLYTGDLNISSIETAYDVLKLAKYLGAKDLEVLCGNHILACSSSGDVHVHQAGEASFPANDIFIHSDGMNMKSACSTNGSQAASKQTVSVAGSLPADGMFNLSASFGTFLVDRSDSELLINTVSMPVSDIRQGTAEIAQAVSTLPEAVRQKLTTSQSSDEYEFEFPVTAAPFSLGSTQSQMSSELPQVTGHVGNEVNILDALNAQKRQQVIGDSLEQDWATANGHIKDLEMHAGINVETNLYNGTMLESQFSVDQRQSLTAAKLDEHFIQLYLGNSFAAGDSQSLYVDQTPGAVYSKHNASAGMQNADHSLTEFDMIAPKPFPENAAYNSHADGKNYNVGGVNNIGDDTCSLDLLQDFVSASCSADGHSLLNVIDTRQPCDAQIIQNFQVPSPATPDSEPNHFATLTTSGFALHDHARPTFERTQITDLIEQQVGLNMVAISNSVSVPAEQSLTVTEQLAQDSFNGDRDVAAKDGSKQAAVPLKKRLHVLASHLSQALATTVEASSTSSSDKTKQVLTSANLTCENATLPVQRFRCNICYEEYVKAKVFKVHMTEMHKVVKPFVCDFNNCNFRSDRYSKLQKHVDIHSGSKAYACPNCGKKFAQQKGIVSHRRSCIEQRTHECSICKEKFNYAAALKVHFRHHTGEKPYSCAKCPATFADSSNYKRHLRTHENVCPYPCRLCPKQFRHSNTLKAHLAACHKDG